MRGNFAPSPVYTPCSEHLEEINQLIKKNLILDAWAKVEGELTQWAPGKPRTAAAKLTYHLGNPRLSHCLRLLNARAHRTDFDYSSYFYYWKLQYLGAYHCLPELYAQLDSPSLNKDEDKAEILTLIARCHSMLREHTVALDSIDKAIELTTSDTAWSLTNKASILTAADKFELALGVSQEAYALDPQLTDSGLGLAEAFRQLGQFDEAEKVLLECHSNYQNAAYVSRLQAIYSEQENTEKAIWSLNEFVRLSPLLPKHTTSWVAGRKADMLIIENKLDEAEAQLEQASSAYHKAALKKLRSRKGPDYKRKRLQVPFIKQHNMTCAPSTLASIAKYWGDTYDHLEIADAICYDGTPWHKERIWLRQQNYFTKEFKLTESALYALIDLDIPFTVTTNGTTGGHIQACIGYDQRTGVVIMRDPTYAHYTEIAIQELLDEHPVEGPRALLILPREKSQLVSEIEFLDSELYDAYHELSVGLEKGDSNKIDAALAEMESQQADHPLTHRAAQEAARFYGDSKTEAQIGIARAETYPAIEKYAYACMFLIHREQGTQPYLDFVAQQVARPEHDPIFDAELGEAYLEKRSSWPEAKKLLKRALRMRPSESRSYASYSKYYSLTGDTVEAAKLMRIASILAPSHEYYATSYFELCVTNGERTKGIDFLKQRVKEAADKHPDPSISLADSYIQINAEELAKETIESALSQHPDHGSLLTQSASYLVKWGQPERGWELLLKAKGKLPDAEWFYRAGNFHNFLGDKTKALEAFTQAYKHNPSYTGAINAIANLKAHYDAAEATAFLEEQLQLHPDNTHLLNILISWHAEQNPERSSELVSQLLEKTPNNTWAWRQMAINLMVMRQYDNALEPAKKAHALQPNSPESNGILAEVFEKLGDIPSALQHYREALTLNIDYTWAARKLTAIARSSKDTTIHHQLSFIKEQMEKQVTDGSIIPVFWEESHIFLPQEDLTKLLQHVCELRPDLWQAHTILANHLTYIDKPQAALKVMLDASKAFPLIPRIWVELAKAYKATSDRQGEIQALEKALQLSPSWDWVGRMLSEAYEWIGKIDLAEDVLRKTLTWNPSHAPNAGMLADLLWKKGDKELAYQTLSEGLKKDYDYGWGWTTISEWSTLLDKDFLPLVEHHRKQLGHLPYWWDAESDIWENNRDYDKSLHCIEKAIELAPNRPIFWSKKAYYLTQLQRFREAEEACSPPLLEHSESADLEVRKAWVMWQAGRAADAMKLLDSTLEKHPQHIWAHQEYLSWHASLAHWDKVAEKAKHLCKLTPESIAAWNRLAQASIQLNNVNEAITALERSHRIDPTNDYAPDTLLRLYLENNLVEDAKELLERIRHYQAPSVVALNETRIALCSNNEAEIKASLVRMIHCESGAADDFSEIDDMLKHKGCKKLFAQTVRTEVNEGRAGNPAAIQAWIYDQRFPLKVAKKLQALPYEDSLKIAAWNWMIEWVEQMEDKSLPNKLASRHPIYHSNTHLWGRLLYLLHATENYQRAIKWSDDYRQRENVQPWMMVNRVLSLLSVNALDEALATSDFAINSLPPDENTSMVETLHACLLAIKGDETSARQILENPHNSDSEWGENYLLITRLILHSAEKKRAKQLWKELKANNPEWQKNHALRNLILAARKRFRKKKNRWPQMMLIAERGSNPFTSALLYAVYIFKLFMILFFIALLLMIGMGFIGHFIES